MSDLKSAVLSLVDAGGVSHVWVPTDFAAFGSRDAVDKTLQRLVRDGELRRIDRGLYDRPTMNGLTNRPSSPDYRAVVDAIARRDQLRLLVDGMTAANDLGLTDAVPARVTIHTDARRRSVKLENLVIEFKQTAPSRLYWAGRPAMRVVQALHWLRDTLATDRPQVLGRLGTLLENPVHGDAVRKDLLEGFGTLPTWMQGVVRELPGCDPKVATATLLKRPRSTPRRPRPRNTLGVAA
ncbi:MAG: DUF6088 family protein [Pseudomonadota bacterium]|nr:DUF6088 family protein [Pseudomonadota bacterium]